MFIVFWHTSLWISPGLEMERRRDDDGTTDGLV